MTKSIKYSGTWRFYKKEEFFQGDLYVDREHRTISLDIILTAEDGRKRPGTPYRGRVPFINGKLFNGDSVLLSGCQFVRVFRDSGATWRARFSAGYAFWGLTVEDESEIKFREAFFLRGDGKADVLHLLLPLGDRREQRISRLGQFGACRDGHQR